MEAYMQKVDTDKKLELVRMVRMQNHYDRQTLKSRENLLYSMPGAKPGEIYGLEATAMPLTENLGQRTHAERGSEKKSVLKGFRIRFVFAMVLFLSFVYCDRQNVSIGTLTTDTLFQKIIESESFSTLREFMK